MEEWKDGRVEKWEKLNTEAQRALRNTEEREWKKVRMEDVEIRQFDNSTIRQWKNGMVDNGKPKGKPQRGVILIELMDSMKFEVQRTEISRQATAWRNVC